LGKCLEHENQARAERESHGTVEKGLLNELWFTLNHQVLMGPDIEATAALCRDNTHEHDEEYTEPGEDCTSLKLCGVVFHIT